MKSKKGFFFPLMVILLVIIIGSIATTFYFKNQEKLATQNSYPNLKQEALSNKLTTNMRETFTYSLPPNWKDTTPSDALFYTFSAESGDFKDNPNGYGRLSGANLSVHFWENAPVMSAKDIMIDYLNKAFRIKNAEIESIKIGNLEGYHSHVLWEGEADYYIVANDKYYWKISFSCGGECTSQYNKDRDYFLNSLKFQ